MGAGIGLARTPRPSQDGKGSPAGARRMGNGDTATAAGGASASERIDLIDALRGFALLGILLANINYWGGWLFMSPAQRIALAGLAQADWASFLEKLLIDGKFYTLFSLLFGLGFTLQLSRLERRGADGVRIFRKRLLILLGFGLIHLCLIWDGDILTLYAALGLMLPWFRGWSDRRMLVAALVLLLLPLAGQALLDATGWAPHAPFYRLGEQMGIALGAPLDPLAWMQSRDLKDFLAWLATGWSFRIGGLIETWRLPKVLGIMLIGMVLGRRVVAGTLFRDRRLFWIVLGIGLLIGLPASYAYAIDEKAGQQDVAAIIGTAPLGFAYGAAFVLAWSWARPVLRVFVAPGRMALTNYLTHSILGIILFRGFTLGWAGKLEPMQLYGVALAIYAAQVAFSWLWLKRFDQGPMEALWRRLTYGKRRPQKG